MNTICITNRALSERPFFEQVENVTLAHPRALVLREKDLNFKTYMNYAIKCNTICHTNGTKMLLHGLDLAAADYLYALLLASCAPKNQELLFDGIQLSMKDFLWARDHVPREIFETLKKRGFVIGVSTHTVAEAAVCEERGADFITASHIFPTDCKKGLPPRGLGYLQDVCDTVSLPVYALGGINETNADFCTRAGASGVCVMSLCMESNAARRLKTIISMG